MLWYIEFLVAYGTCQLVTDLLTWLHEGYRALGSRK